MNFAKNIIKGIINREDLSSLVLFVTHRCNAKCSFCFNSFLTGSSGEGISYDEMQISEYEKIAKNSRNLFQLIIGGGEPFIRDDILQIIRMFYENASVKLFSIPTNGLLKDKVKNTVEEMLPVFDKATFNIEISVDAVGEKHDRLRNVNGLFDSLIDLAHNINRLRNNYSNLNLVMNTTVTMDNINNIIELQSFLEKEFSYKMPLHNIVLDCRIGSKFYKDSTNYEKIDEIKSKANEIISRSDLTSFQKLISKYYTWFINKMILKQSKKDKVIFNCNAGSKICVIMPDGDVSPCEPFIFDEYRGFKNKFNIRNYNYDYSKLQKDDEFRTYLEHINSRGCLQCAWSCAYITSLIYNPSNWKHLL